MSSGNLSPAKSWSNINSMKIYDTITEFVVIVKFFAVQSVLFLFVTQTKKKAHNVVYNKVHSLWERKWRNPEKQSWVCVVFVCAGKNDCLRLENDLQELELSEFMLTCEDLDRFISQLPIKQVDS